MKKVVTILVFFIALANIVGFTPFYYSALQEIKSEVSLKLASNSDLRQMLISGSDYNNRALFSMLNENEFRFNERMYDFKSVKKVGDDYIFYVVADNQESNLLALLKSTYGQTNENHKNSKGPLANLLKNFSKDFVGSFLKTIKLPANQTQRASRPPDKNICAGYFCVVMNPPDRKYF